ncbi:MAG: hypothetical protein V3T13_07965 [Hyphomicrobium sp.]
MAQDNVEALRWYRKAALFAFVLALATPGGELNILATFKQRFALLACAREARIKNGRHTAGI